jgi:hypothetical protein
MFSPRSLKRPVAAFGVAAGLLTAAVPAGATGTNPGQPNQGLPSGTTTATQQGIIMRDGGICDPNRHMGC